MTSIKSTLKQCLLILALLLPLTVFAQESVVNIYGFGEEIPDFIVRQFEKETGIHVNIATYQNNEMMYARLSAVKNPGYDIVMPTNYFVDRLKRHGLLEKLDKTKLSNWKNLNPDFLHLNYDRQSDYSVPNIWGVTGIFVNKARCGCQVKTWADLWDPRYRNQLLLMDDARGIFSATLLSLGYSLDDYDPQHIKAAFLKLKKLMNNVKVFSTDSAPSIMIDEDATLGIVLNGDTFKATQENPNVTFVFPEDGFSMWIDHFAVLKNAPHKEAAYAFINFMLRADVAAATALATHFATTNSEAQKRLPVEIRNNPIIYPDKTVLRRGHFGNDVDNKILALYEKYWEELKMGE